MMFIARLGNVGAGPDEANVMVRTVIGRPNVATPTLFRDLRKHLRSFRPTLRSIDLLRTSGLMTESTWLEMEFDSRSRRRAPST
jgi:hypothetical protein